MRVFVLNTSFFFMQNNSPYFFGFATLWCMHFTHTYTFFQTQAHTHTYRERRGCALYLHALPSEIFLDLRYTCTLERKQHSSNSVREKEERTREKEQNSWQEKNDPANKI